MAFAASLLVLLGVAVWWRLLMILGGWVFGVCLIVSICCAVLFYWFVGLLLIALCGFCWYDCLVACFRLCWLVVCSFNSVVVFVMFLVGVLRWFCTCVYWLLWLLVICVCLFVVGCLWCFLGCGFRLLWLV